MDRNRAKGMLWGLVVGDCLGSPIQFSGKDDHPHITEMVPCPVFNVPAGYWTDDSSMAMCIMDSFVRKGRYSLTDIADTFVRWFLHGYLSSVEGRSFDVGHATAVAMMDLKCGKYSNGTEDTQGNGSIMRFAPSLLVASVEDDPVEIAFQISDLTHASSRLRYVIDRFSKILYAHLEGRRTALKSIYKSRDEVDNSGWAVSTLEAALWAFKSTKSFEEALVAAVNLGGDSDSIGAVCGQIAGAYYGFSAIPDRWVKAVKTWQKVDDLIERFLTALDVRKKEREEEGDGW